MSTMIQSTSSPWRAAVRMPPSPKLTGEHQTDICIVGAGIAGLSVGYLLSKAGRKVIVLDDGKIGGGQTEVTTAHLSSAIDRRYIDIEKIHGSDVSRLVAESHSAAIERIDSIVADENIPCDFRRLDGYLFLPPDDSSDLLD